MVACYAILAENALSGGFKGAYILDIVAVLLFVALSYIGARKGAIKSLIGFVSTILSLVLAFVLANEVASLLNQAFSLTDALARSIEKALLKINGFNIDVSAAGMSAALEGVTLPSFIKDALVDKFADKTLPVGTTLAQKAGEEMAGLFMKLVAGILVFFLVKLALALLSGVLTGIARKVKAVSATNTMIGALLGVFKAFVIVCGVLALVSFIPSEPLVEFFNQTFLLKYLYNDNPLMRLLTA